jgi:phenylalanyl-tRNA synthetase beta chain
MKITLSLLKKFLNIKDQPKDIANILTQLGIEVDKIEKDKPFFTNVVSAKVIETKKCPNSDKLTIAKVFDGKDTFQVVCGAVNCRKDIIVAKIKEYKKRKKDLGKNRVSYPHNCIVLLAAAPRPR